MQIEKKHLDDIKRCYAAANIPMFGKNYYVFASEDPGICCEMFSGQDFEDKEVLWTEPGGCMSIMPIPGREGEILAVQEFYLKVSPSKSKIVWGKYDPESGWAFQDVLHLPFLHRFGIFEKGENLYLVCATIAETKEHKEDWRVPGKIYAGLIPEDLDQGVELEEVVGGLFRNHGYWQTVENGETVGYFGSDQGILRLTAPDTLGGDWNQEMILEGAIGEIATLDIDGDGQVEIMTIEPFHGDTIRIYKKQDGAYAPVYEYGGKVDFAHTLVGCNLLGKPTFVAGIRREDAELIAVQWEDGAFKTTVIDQGSGPANVAVVNEEGRDLILAANHTANEAAVYIITE